MLTMRLAGLLVTSLACGLAGCATTTPHEGLPALAGLAAAPMPATAAPGTATADAAALEAAVPWHEAAPAPAAADEWTFLISPYLWMTAIDGNGTVKGNKADFNVNFSDIWNNLDFAALVALEASHDNWSFILDTIYLKVQGDASTGPVDVDATVEAAIITALVAHPFVSPDTLQWFVGARYWNLNSEVSSNGFGDFEGSKHWVDPVVGVRNTWQLDKDWSINGWADIGGFNVGSKSQWETALTAGYQVSPGGKLYAGYRAISVDYVDGNGSDRFEFNSTLKGPIIGGAIRF